MYKQPFIVLFTTIDILVDKNIPNIFLSAVAQIYKMSWGEMDCRSPLLQSCDPMSTWYSCFPSCKCQLPLTLLGRDAD